MKFNLVRGVAALFLVALASSAGAHTGHGTESLYQGLVHPFGLDHLLAMLAVGLWSVFSLPAGRAWMGPATFMLALVISAAVGSSGVTVPFLEVAISASVVVFGAMLIMASRRLPVGLGLCLVAVAASLHGLAHGAESPSSAGFVSYAVGFLMTTAALHFGGVFTGLSLRRWFATRAPQIVGGLGVACGGAGLYLLSQF